MVRGGKAVAAGTYGCVFSPGLSCENGERQPGTVSKLMDRESADEEYRESAFVRVAMESMDASLRDLLIVPLQAPCKPSRLTSTDLIDVTVKCPAFTGINDKLEKLRILTQTDGGRMLESFSLPSISEPTFERITLGLVQVLFAVSYLNLRGVLHGDVKAANMVVQEKTGIVRLIDWGFTRTLDAEYTGRFWRGYSYSVIMFNCMPSMWAYNLYVNSSKRPRNDSIVDYIHFTLQNAADSNQYHLTVLDKLFTACNQARAAYYMPVITYNEVRDADGDALSPIMFADGSTLSQITTQILVAHAAAVYIAILSPDGERLDKWTRFFTLVDTVLRVNVDVFGVLMCFEGVVAEPPSARRDLILASLSSYLMSAAYAVQPYNVDEVADVLRGLCRPGAVPPVPKPNEEKFLIPVDALALESAMDPGYTRAFMSDTYISGMRAKQPVELTPQEQMDEIRGAAQEGGGARGLEHEVEVVDMDFLCKEKGQCFTPPQAPGFGAVPEAGFSFTSFLESIVDAPSLTPKAPASVVFSPPAPPARPPKRQRREGFGGRRLSGGVMLALYKHE